MSITKRLLSGNKVCEVTFTLAGSAIDHAQKVAIVGDFCDFVPDVYLMKKEDGKFKTTIRLQTGKQYLFHYLIDDTHWVNDKGADEYTKECNGEKWNSVISL